MKWLRLLACLPPFQENGLSMASIYARRSEEILNIRAFCGLTLIFALTAFAVSPVSARNQDKKGEAALRTIHGSVVDKNENAVPQAWFIC